MREETSGADCGESKDTLHVRKCSTCGSSCYDGEPCPLCPDASPIGRPIGREEALRIAEDIQEKAEAERTPVDVINSPPWYTWHPMGIECADIVGEFSFNVGEAMAHLWRHGRKPGVDAVLDLKEAVWHIRREIKRLTRRHDMEYLETELKSLKAQGQI